MKKTAILLLFTALIACNKNTKAQLTKNNKVLWAENIQSIVPFPLDAKNTADALLHSNFKFIEKIMTSCWDAAFQYDKEKIFSSITHTVLSGKLKAYTDFPVPGTALTLKEFNNILVYWDSTSYMRDDPKNPGITISAPVHFELTSRDITRIKFNETIEFDTVSYTLIKKVSTVTFFTYKEPTESGEIIGEDRELFYVKLNDLDNERKEKGK